MAFGSGDALTAGSKISEATELDELRSAIHPSRRYSVTTQVSGSLPAAGTQFIVSYQWANLTSLTAEHMFLTERVREEPGLDVCVRQPIPYFGGLPGHVEATADLRNLLAQGYVPLDLGARRTYLVQMPRSVRGGLNFIF